MRHHNTKRKFGRERGQRIALMRSLARSLLLRGKITTSLPKAKELRPFVERLITKSKVSSVASRRLLQSRTGSAEVASKLVSEIGPKYKSRKGGYTRITKLSLSRKDGGDRAVIELL